MTRNTIQKMKIMDHLKMVKTHPTAQMVYDAVKKDLPSITLATVYRNLNLLAKEGKVLRLEVNGEYRFDGDIGHHQHCVCTECGGIKDCFQENINDYALGKVKVPGFDPQSVSVKFYGLCSRCKSKKTKR